MSWSQDQMLEGRSSEYYPLPLLFNEPQPIDVPSVEPEIAALDAVIASMMLGSHSGGTGVALVAAKNGTVRTSVSRVAVPMQRRQLSPPAMIVRAQPVPARPQLSVNSTGDATSKQRVPCSPY